ncbi:thioredoxin [Micractinium conductrix]|uniref:Thioredoxin n=1 Tax=Micractinium conductrix TaxID=554055 RepID=A0A2P6VHN4_9CHLO|nr:thioredoxin [Micractinium conductrix]|eukprot:PSC73603.1 thioredoxin [Micractinium conductrix]
MPSCPPKAKVAAADTSNVGAVAKRSSIGRWIRRPGRRLLLLQSLRAGAVAAVGTSAVPADVCHGRDSKFSHFEALHVTERSNILELPSHKHTANAADHKLHRQQQPGAVAPAPFCGDSGAPAPVAAPPTRPAPRVLEVCSASELRHLMTCHPNRLLVVHFAAGGCPLGEAFAPALTDACRRFPAALFLRIVVPAAAEESLSEENAALFQGLHLDALPCTLLLHGQQLLARLEAGIGGGAGQPGAAAAAAAHALNAAVAAALPPEPAPAAPAAPEAAARAGPRFAYVVAA